MVSGGNAYPDEDEPYPDKNFKEAFQDPAHSWKRDFRWRQHQLHGHFTPLCRRRGRIEPLLANDNPVAGKRWR